MNNLFAKFGYEMTTGVLVKRDTNLQADVILSYPTKEADSIAYDFGTMRNRRMVITTPSTAGLEQIADKGYTVTNSSRQTRSVFGMNWKQQISSMIRYV